MSQEITIRDATAADMPAISAIYSYHVLHGTGSFETVPPSEEEMKKRWQEVLARPAPYLVACDASGKVLGYCYAGYYNRRAAYARTVEDSIYVSNAARGQGIGSQLFAALIERCRQAGFAKMLSVIGDSQNAGSIGLHRKFGCREVGVVHECGEKFGRLLDVVFMELDLQKTGATK